MKAIAFAAEILDCINCMVVKQDVVATFSISAAQSPRTPRNNATNILHFIGFRVYSTPTLYLSHE